MFKSVKLISVDVMEESEACIMYNNTSAASFFSLRKCERLLTVRKFEARSVDLHLTESNRLDELVFLLSQKALWSRSLEVISHCSDTLSLGAHIKPGLCCVLILFI